MDIISAHGHKYSHIILDYTTRYPEVIPRQPLKILQMSCSYYSVMWGSQRILSRTTGPPSSPKKGVPQRTLRAPVPDAGNLENY